jgi:nickel-type superoxide dismutase maturation protease
MPGMSYLLPWQFVRVSGQSMTPALLPGDRVLVRHGAPVVAGAVVLARFRSRPDLLVIKRAARSSDGGWFVVSDNPAAGSDSRQYGTADVHARAVLIWPGQLARRIDRARSQRPSAARLLAVLPHRLDVRLPDDL